MPFFLKHLKQTGHLDQVSMTLFNVGSRKINPEDDYAMNGWEFFAPNLAIYGFDADADACDEANTDLARRGINWTEKHIPLAIADSEKVATLYVTKAPMCSSLYPPNEPFLSRFYGLSELVDLDFEVELETTSLDSFCRNEGVTCIDFLQMDVQGAEIQVLEGASDLLKKGILVIQTEVSFAEIYLNQPLFSDIDQYLRGYQYSLFHLDTSCRTRKNSPILSSIRPGQLLWGEAYYIIDLLSDTVDDSYKTPEQLLKLACIADVLEFPDYSLELLEYLTVRYGHEEYFNMANAIIESLVEHTSFLSNPKNFIPLLKRLRFYISSECSRQYEIDRLIA